MVHMTRENTTKLCEQEKHQDPWSFSSNTQTTFSIFQGLLFWSLSEVNGAQKNLMRLRNMTFDHVSKGMGI